MNTFLILVTSNYPYGKGETFLETEIHYLAKEFTKIYIIPTKACSTENLRQVPSNITINNSIQKLKNTESTNSRIAGKLFSIFTFRAFLRELLWMLINKCSFKSLSVLFTFSRDAQLTKNTINSILKSHIADTDKGIIYSYWLNGTTTGCIFNSYKIPVISRVHRGDLYEELYDKNYIPFRKFTLNSLFRLYFISKFGYKYLSKKYSKFANSFEISRLGVQIPRSVSFSNHNSANKLIVSCSSINKNKRVDKIAHHLIDFASQNPTLSFTWHHFGDGEDKSKIQNIISNIPSNMKCIIHGYTINKYLLDFYASNSIDLFINFSKSEGIPVSIMEAGSFGIPTIATNVGGTSELISNENGWLIAKDLNPDEIYKAFREALINEEISKKKGQLSKLKIEQLFDAEKNYSKFAKELRNLL